MSTAKTARPGPRANAFPAPASAPPRARAGTRRLKGVKLAKRWHMDEKLFFLPVLVVLAVLFLYPLVRSFYFSLTDFNGYTTDANFVGLSNYSKVFTDPSMLSALGFTMLYTVATTLAVTVLAIPLAVVLNRRFIGRRFVQSVFFFPAIPSLAILGLVWGFIFNPLGSGMINSILDSVFHVGPIPWLSDNALARFAIIVVGVWTQLGWHAILYLAYLQAVPEELYEVAMLDGASARQRFFSITLPLLTPAITVSTLLLMTGGLKVYDLPYTFTRGGPGFATETITQSIIQNGVAQAKFGEGSALAVVFLLLVGALVLAQLFLARKVEERFS